MTQPYFRSFIKDNTIVLVGQILVSLRSIILMPVIIKTVGVKLYGGYVLLSLTFSLIYGISSFGVGLKARRFLPSTKDVLARRDLFYPQFFFQLASVITLSLVWILLHKAVNIYIFKNEITYSAVLVPFYLIAYFLYSQGTDYFRYTSRVMPMMVAAVSYLYIQIGLILFLSYYDFLSVNVLILMEALAMLTAAIPCLYILIKEIGFDAAFFDKQSFVSDIKIGFPIVLGLIQEFVLSVIGRFFIAIYLTVSAVGCYSSAYTLGSMIMFIPKAMGTAIPQLLSKATDNNDVYEAQQMVNYSLKIFLLLAIPFTLGSIVLGKPILMLLANREVAESASLIIPIVALGSLFYGLNSILSNVLFVRLKTMAIFKMNLFASVFNLVANLVFLYFFRNIIVSAIITFASYFIAFLYIYKIVHKEWSVDFQAIIVGKSFAAALLMVAILFWVSNNFETSSASFVAGELIIGIAVYGATLLAMRTFSAKELLFVKKYINR